MTENFLKLISNAKPHIQATQRPQSRTNVKKTTPRHILFKLQKTKDKEKILKGARGWKFLSIWSTDKNYI